MQKQELSQELLSSEVSKYNQLKIYLKKAYGVKIPDYEELESPKISEFNELIRNENLDPAKLGIYYKYYDEVNAFCKNSDRFSAPLMLIWTMLPILLNIKDINDMGAIIEPNIINNIPNSILILLSKNIGIMFDNSDLKPVEKITLIKTLMGLVGFCTIVPYEDIKAFKVERIDRSNEDIRNKIEYDEWFDGRDFHKLLCKK